MTASLKRNVIANGVGQGWRVAMTVAFIPIYIKYLGIEAYGLIGIFALLQSWLTLLDMGMKPALSREMARFSGGAHSPQSIRDLLRSVEVIGVALAAIISLGVWAASRWLASDWLRVESLPIGAVAKAFTVMGVVTALRFIEDIYVSCLAGLELQVQQNAIVAVTATARGLGAVAVLAWISSSIEAFFLWQAVVSVITVALFAGLVHRTLPPAPRRARLSSEALRGIWHFAAGMMAITGLSLLLTQVDKILLSRLLTLKAYGYYALAGVVSNGLAMLQGPVTAAFYPRFTALTTLGKEVASRAAYHQGAQLVATLMGSAAAILIVFRYRAILLWMGDPVIAAQVAPLMAVMVLGTLLNGLISIPYQMMLAHGWTSLTVKFAAVAVGIFVPAILWAVPRYGAVAAVWIWVVLNIGHLVFTVPLMHRRLLRGEKWRWYGQDVALPLAAAAGAALLCRRLTPPGLGRTAGFGALLVSSAFTLLASALAAPALRNQIARHLPDTLNPLASRAA